METSLDSIKMVGLAFQMLTKEPQYTGCAIKVRNFSFNAVTGVDTKGKSRYLVLSLQPELSQSVQSILQLSGMNFLNILLSILQSMIC